MTESDCEGILRRQRSQSNVAASSETCPAPTAWTVLEPSPMDPQRLSQIARVRVIVTIVNIHGNTDQPSFVALFSPDGSYLVLEPTINR